MCGINGLISKEGLDREAIANSLSKMNQEIIHRGPDQDGFYSEEMEGSGIGMAMRRLSIIDLLTGEQPMKSSDGNVVLVFNGEIYNFPKLKKDLIEAGCEFKTTSDTEVILKLYEKFGVKSFSMLDGMFAFSIHDKNLGKIYIARDFFGEKPLYYTRQRSSFYWASELKSIMVVNGSKPPISREGLNLYFQLTYIPAPFTIYEDIFKLKSNHFLEIDCGTMNFSENEIQQNFSKNVNSDISFKEAKKETHRLVYKSVESRSISDVSLGTFLSGGVDSSIVSLCLAQNSDKKIDTFSIGFEKKSFDETDKSREVAKIINSNHHEFVVSEGDLKNNVDEILLNFDEPFADSSSLPTYLVANKTRQQVKVALTGDGGDEVFGGYNKYYIGKLNNKYISIVPKAFHKSIAKTVSPLLSTKDDNRGTRFKIKKLLNAINYEGDFYYQMISLGFQEWELKNILKISSFEPNSMTYFKEQIGERNKSLTHFRDIDRLISMEGDSLVKVDRTSMLTSLESRAPFLNKELWNFTSQLSEDYLMKGWNKKYILKETFNHYFPKGFLDKSKKGFGVPVGDWLRGFLREELLAYSESNFLETQGIFEPENIREIVRDHLSGKTDYTFKVWTFYCFQKWFINIY